MLIGIDGNEANVERLVGIGEYAYELLMQFKKIQDSRFKIQVYLKNSPREGMPKEDSNWKYIVVKPKKLWTQIGLPFYLFTHFPRPDVFFTPTHYAPRFSPVPTVISIMDLSYIHFPELFTTHDLYQLKNWTKYSAKNASKIFTISEASKRDILKEYQRKPDDVIVTHLGIKEDSRFKISHRGTLPQEDYVQRTVAFKEGSQDSMTMEDLQKKFGIKRKYILFVGTLQPRKNISKLIEAFSLVNNSRGPATPHPQNSLQSRSLPAEEFRGSPSRVTPSHDLQLVIVGKKGWLYEDILAAPEKFGVKNQVKFLDFVSDEDLPSLYKNAEVFVLPSLYEGFGLPVLEAMKYGCPVITSNVSSLPEAGGDAALYVNPENAEDIAEKIKKVLGDKKLRESMIEKGYKHIKQFSWEKAAKKTLEVLEEVGNKR